MRFVTVTVVVVFLTACSGNGSGQTDNVPGVRGARSGVRAVMEVEKKIPTRGPLAGNEQGDEALLESLYTLATTDLLLILGRTEDRRGTLDAYLADAMEGIRRAKRREEEMEPRLQDLSDIIADLEDSAENLRGDLEDRAEEDPASVAKISSDLATVSERLTFSEEERDALADIREAVRVFRSALELQIAALEENREAILEGNFHGELPGIPYLRNVQRERREE